MLNSLRFVLPGILLAVLVPMLLAEECANLCGHCGRSCVYEKVCRMTQETKKVSKTAYTWECEDFCVPGPSRKIGCHEECREGHCWPACLRTKKVWDWAPSCDEVRTRVKLVKKTVDEEMVVPKCVVVLVCPHCQGHCGVEACAPAGQK